MNVGYVLDEAQLTRYFSRYGTVTDCYLPVRAMTLALFANAFKWQGLFLLRSRLVPDMSYPSQWDASLVIPARHFSLEIQRFLAHKNAGLACS